MRPVPVPVPLWQHEQHHRHGSPWHSRSLSRRRGGARPCRCRLFRQDGFPRRTRGKELDDYVASAVRLIDDVEWRGRAGRSRSRAISIGLLQGGCQPVLPGYGEGRRQRGCAACQSGRGFARLREFDLYCAVFVSPWPGTDPANQRASVCERMRFFRAADAALLDGRIVKHAFRPRFARTGGSAHGEIG